MNQQDHPGEVTLRRYTDREHQVLAAVGEFGPFLDTWIEHTKRWETELDGLTFAMMRQGLAATTLHLSFRPGDESVGFTFNFRKPSVNVFVSGDAGAATVTGRAFTEGVKTAESSRLFVRSYRNGPGNWDSAIEIEGLDLLDGFEQYYRQSEQTPARLFEPEENRFHMALALPDVDGEWLAELDADAAARWIASDLEFLDERVFRFRCGCTLEKLLQAIHGMFVDKPEELFLGDPEVEALCPRCGTRWTVSRESFDTYPDRPA